MHFEGNETIQVPLQTVWDFFMDTQRVAACAPGFQRLEILAPDHFKPTVSVGIGPVKATFTLDVVLEDMRPPSHATMRGHGVAAGSAVDLVSQLDLSALSDSSTSLKWTMDATVTGTIASVGARLMESTAQKLTGRFFECISRQLGAAAAPH